MHSVYGRLLSRSIVGGLYNCSSSSSGSRTNVTITANETAASKAKPKLVSAVAGFPKSFKSGKVRKGQIGDDAWLVSNVDSADILGMSFLYYKFPLCYLSHHFQLLLMVLVDGETMVLILVTSHFHYCTLSKE